MAFSILPIRIDNDLWLTVVALLDETGAALLVDDEDSRCHVLAAVDDDVGVIGAAVLEMGTVGYGPLGANSIGNIEVLFVSPEFRGKGVGKRLICETLNYAWQCGCDSVRASVGYEETTAISLFEQLGLAFMSEEDFHAVGGEPRYTVIAIQPARVNSGYAAEEE
jgi:ribosomal protein S18 acetylase RimI-like enzyme